MSFFPHLWLELSRFRVSGWLFARKSNFMERKPRDSPWKTRNNKPPSFGPHHVSWRVPRCSGRSFFNNNVGKISQSSPAPGPEQQQPAKRGKAASPWCVLTGDQGIIHKCPAPGKVVLPQNSHPTKARSIMLPRKIKMLRLILGRSSPQKFSTLLPFIFPMVFGGKTGWK